VTTNTPRKRELTPRERGLLWFKAYVLGRLSIAAFQQQEANEKRAERVRAEAHRPLVVHYDAAKDETVTLSESRREHWPENLTRIGYPRGYGKPGQNLRVHSGIVKPVGVLAQWKGKLFGADGTQL